MGIYTKVSFEYMAGSNARELDPAKVGRMVSEIIGRFSAPGSWENAETVQVYADGPERDGCYHWAVVPRDEKGNRLISMGALLRPGSDNVEFHS